MDAVEVVEAQVGIKLAAQAGEARVQVAGKCRAQALLEDRAVQRLDVAVGLRATGVDAGVARLQPAGRLGEVALELIAGNRSSRQPASRRSLATRRANLEVCLALGVPGVASLQITSSAQA